MIPTEHDLVVTPTGVRFMRRRFPYSLGRSGIVAPEAKREGDGATPAGVMRIVGMLYRPDRIAAPQPWAIPIGPADLWSDAPEDDDYNQMVRAPYKPSHEKLRRGDPMYDVVLVTDWNYPLAMAHMGSAIFVHQWRGPHRKTAGCLAFSRQDMHWIAKRVQIGTQIFVPYP